MLIVNRHNGVLKFYWCTIFVPILCYVIKNITNIFQLVT